MLPPRGESIGKWAIVKRSQRRSSFYFGTAQGRVDHKELYIDIGYI
jgi:hypothetical protein